MSVKVVVECESLNLCHLGPDSAEQVLHYYNENKEHFTKTSPAFHDDFFTLAYQEKLLQAYQTKQDRDQMVKFWLFAKDDPQFRNVIGDISFNNIIRSAFQSCFVGYKMDKDNLNKGYMTEALGGVINYAWDELKLHRIEANIMPFNIPSIELVEKIGFKKEGFSEKYLKINGKWENHLRYAILNEEPPVESDDMPKVVTDPLI